MGSKPNKALDRNKHVTTSKKGANKCNWAIFAVKSRGHKKHCHVERFVCMQQWKCVDFSHVDLNSVWEETTGIHTKGVDALRVNLRQHPTNLQDILGLVCFSTNMSSNWGGTCTNLNHLTTSLEIEIQKNKLGFCFFFFELSGRHQYYFFELSGRYPYHFPSQLSMQEKGRKVKDTILRNQLNKTRFELSGRCLYYFFKWSGRHLYYFLNEAGGTYITF